ncbi:MAG: hydrogenase maturation protease [Acidobacteriota bacterium]
MSQFQLEITEQGYLIFPQVVANQYFPEDVCVAIWREPELWILPIHSSNAGGFLLKQRNAIGDRSVLIHEILPQNWQHGIHLAIWDIENVALRIALNYG